jgi:alpha-tubulin suppressor-like RCC1 family protein
VLSIDLRIYVQNIMSITHFRDLRAACINLVGGRWASRHAEALCAAFTLATLSLMSPQSAAQPYVQVSAGGNHSCALLPSGGVKCWGSNQYGQLGNASLGNSATPVTVSGISTATAISAGGGHSCAVLASGGVQCWGSGVFGQLGNGSTADSSVLVAVSGISTATAVSTGIKHSCALLASGGVRCWGLGGVVGLLGNGGTADSSTPVPVSGLHTATAVTAGFTHSCAVLASGSVQCWGTGNDGQLGNGLTASSSVPVAVSGITTATAVSVGFGHSCALLASGGVQCWGFRGHLGNGGTADSPTPVAVSGITTATAVSAGFNHSCALLASGGAQCWGGGYVGQLGNGSTTGSRTPVAVSNLTTATAITAGAEHTCALLTSGGVQCWGTNTSGELGDGTGLGNQLTPVFTAQNCDADIDLDGTYSPQTDGLIYQRALLGLSGTAVTDGALGAGAKRTGWGEIRAYLSQVCKVRGLAP